MGYYNQPAAKVRTRRARGARALAPSSSDLHDAGGRLGPARRAAASPMVRRFVATGSTCAVF
jgi:hypothetical protein